MCIYRNVRIVVRIQEIKCKLTSKYSNDIYMYLNTQWSSSIVLLLQLETQDTELVKILLICSSLYMELEYLNL